MPRVDLNCDLGEGRAHDAELFSLITSANIACGGHAGDEDTMRASVELAVRHKVAIGAHPGFADRENFGRVELPVWPEEVFQLVLTQTRTLQRIAREAGAVLSHLKPHGALYNMAARNTLLAAAVAQAAYEVDPRLRLYGLAGSHSLSAGADCGLEVISEVFADRSYQADGTLTQRGQAGALVTEEDTAVAQALRMVAEGKVRATDGSDVSIRADTICVHGDGPRAVGFARGLRNALVAAGAEIANFNQR